MEDPVGHDGGAVFDAYWPRTEPIVRNYILGLLGRHGATDDVVQEVAFTCLRRIDTFDRSRNFAAWALGVARLEVFTHRRQHILLPLGDFPGLEVALSDEQEHLGDDLEPRRKALESCREHLEDRHRRMLDLRYRENCSHDEMAGRLQMSIGAIKVALSRIRTLLRRCVEHRVGGTGAP